MLFTAGGAAAFLLPAATMDLALDLKGLLVVAELGLVMTLFTDASRISRSRLSTGRSLPIRLLTAGMLLTLALGALIAIVLFRGLSWWEAGILAAILAPTDAGLGQVIVNSERVPQNIRQSLNVEAGLNDGLSVPFLLLFIALAVTEEGTLGRGRGVHALSRRTAGLRDADRTRHWHGRWLAPGTGQAQALDGAAAAATWRSGAPAALRRSCPTRPGQACSSRRSSPGLRSNSDSARPAGTACEFTEDWGQLFDYFVFFFFGTVVAGTWSQFTPSVLLYAVLSLTLVRMVPVALALRGTGLSRASVLFMGWFGPRGLASIVLGLVYLEQEAHLDGESTIRVAVMATVMLSIFAHGLSALPGIRLYAKRIASLNDDAPELQASEDDSRAPPHAPKGGSS